MHLSPRQLQIISLVAAGLSDKAIARQLGISPRTIRTHLEKLFHAYGLHTRAAAVCAWLRQGTYDR
jgi:DNA-binding NarL/FixJ family response regulator